MTAIYQELMTVAAGSPGPLPTQRSGSGRANNQPVDQAEHECGECLRHHDGLVADRADAEKAGA